MGYFTLDLGLTEEQNDQIEQFIRRNFVTRAHYDKRTHEYEEKIEELTNLSKDSSQNKASYEKLLKDYDALKVQHEKLVSEQEHTIQSIRIDYAIRDVLKQEGARNIEIVRRQLKDEMITLEKDGSLKGLEEQIQSLKKDPQTNFLFYEDKLQGSTSAVPNVVQKNTPEEPTSLDNFVDQMSSFSRALHPPSSP